MAEGRGKKAKKPRWQLVLGLKQVLCGALGLTWMMVIIFILGVLAGRGDIYRWLSGWGLVTMEAPRVAQWPPPPPGTPGAKPLPASAAAIPGAPPPAPTAAPHAPATASPAHPHSTAPHTRKSKRAASLREQKAKQEEMRRLRREVAKKLKFQNSFDSSPSKPRHGTLKLKAKPPAAKGPAHSRVARFRDAKAARVKLAELQKKGGKVALKSGKDKKGAYYDIIRQTPAHPQEASGPAQKTPKSSRHKPKTHKETGR
jgi:hypothetical protein